MNILSVFIFATLSESQGLLSKNYRIACHCKNRYRNNYITVEFHFIVLNER